MKGNELTGIALCNAVSNIIEAIYVDMGQLECTYEDITTALCEWDFDEEGEAI